MKRNGETVTKRKFDVANDGGVLHPENWSVRWEENCVNVIISGEEQADELYTYFFDGTVRYESLAVREPEAHEPVPQEALFDEPATEFSDIVVENENGESVFDIPMVSLRKTGYRCWIGRILIEKERFHMDFCIDRFAVGSCPSDSSAAQHQRPR